MIDTEGWEKLKGVEKSIPGTLLLNNQTQNTPPIKELQRGNEMQEWCVGKN
jgi:hypothetical protein